MFGMLSVLAEFQRELIVANTRDGLAAARARGRKGGRPSKLSSDQSELAQRLYDAGDHTVAQIADMLKLPRTTVYGHLNKRAVSHPDKPATADVADPPAVVRRHELVPPVGMNRPRAPRPRTNAPTSQSPGSTRTRTISGRSSAAAIAAIANPGSQHSTSLVRSAVTAPSWPAHSPNPPTMEAFPSQSSDGSPTPDGAPPRNSSAPTTLDGRRRVHRETTQHDHVLPGEPRVLGTQPPPPSPAAGPAVVRSHPLRPVGPRRADAATATNGPGTGRDLHELRHSGLTHGEAGVRWS